MAYSVTVRRTGSGAQPEEERFEATEVIIGTTGDLLLTGRGRMSSYDAKAWDSITVVRVKPA